MEEQETKQTESMMSKSMRLNKVKNEWERTQLPFQAFKRPAYSFKKESAKKNDSI